MKKLFCVLLILCLVPPAVPAGAEVAIYEVGYVDGPHYSPGPATVHVRVFKNGVWGNTDDVQEMIRWNISYSPFRENGYFLTGDSVQAGKRVDLLEISNDWMEMTLLLKDPGMYYLWGVEYYVLNPEDEKQAAFARTLEDAVAECAGKNETETARKLENWLEKQIVYPKEAWIYGGDDGNTEMNETVCCAYGVWSTGYGTCGGYSHYYSLLCSIAGIECLEVTGLAGNTGHVWNLNRLDGVWSFTDATWDDGGSKSKNRYFALPFDKMSKDHTLYDDMTAFYSDWFASTPFDREITRFQGLNSLKESIPASLRTLPLSAEAYGFPAANDPKIISLVSAEFTPDLLIYKLNRKTEYLNCVTYEEGYGFEYRGDSVSTAKSDGDRLEWPGLGKRYISIEASDNNPSVSGVLKGASLKAYFINGEPAGTESTLLEPLSPGSVDGCLENSWRSWTLDGYGKPYCSTWYILTRKAEHTVSVYFGEDGTVSSYSVKFNPTAFPTMTSEWTALPDGTVIRAEIRDGNEFLLVKPVEPGTETWNNWLKNVYPDADSAPEGVKAYYLDYSGKGRPSCYMLSEGSLFAWEDGALTIPETVTDYLGKEISLFGANDAMDLQSCRQIAFE